MAEKKPWEKYQTEQQGPWSKYQQDGDDQSDADDYEEITGEIGFVTDNPGEAFRNNLRILRGGADLAVMAARAGAAEIVGGYAGLISFALTGDIDYAASRVEVYQRAIGGDLKTEEGKHAIEAVAPTLSKADAKVDDFGEDVSGGNPAVATAVKTAIWSSLDFAGMLIPGGKTILNSRKLNRLRKQAIAEAERLGIKLKMSDFRDEVADAAKMVGSESPGEMSTEYVAALRAAERKAAQNKKSKYRTARETELYIETSPIRQLGDDLARQLDEAEFDLDVDEMRVVRKALDDFSSSRLGFGRNQNMAVHFSRVERLRKRINRRIRGATNKEASAALNKIKRGLDDYLTEQFNVSVMDAGGRIQQSALSGDLAGFDAYKAARRSAVEHGWFSENKIIADMIKKDTTPEQVSQWLFGASALGAKKEAGLIVRKLKSLLGEDHPSIGAIRADFVYHLVEPLFKETPNFRVFQNTLDTLSRKNKTLFDELGLRDADIQILSDYAKVARHIPESGHLYSFEEVIQTVARLTVGHSVAKGAARVTFATKMMNYLAGADVGEAMTKKAFLDAVVNARFGEPIFPSNSMMAAAVIAGGALSGTMDSPALENRKKHENQY
jgi:hypothetical protein